MLAPELEQILQQLYREARKAHYEFISLEHLLLVLIEEDAAVPNVLKLCGADLKAVSEQLAASVAENTPLIPDHLLDTVETRPTLGFQRVIQRAMVHTQSAGKGFGRAFGRFGRADERNRQPRRLFFGFAICYAF